MNKKIISALAVLLASTMVFSTAIPTYTMSLEDATNQAIYGNSKNNGKNSNSKNSSSNYSKSNNTNKSSNANSSKRTVSYSDIDEFETVYLNASQFIEWAKAHNFTYEESNNGKNYVIAVYIEDPKNRSNKSNNVANSAGEGFGYAATQSLAESLLDWVNGEDVTLDEALNKAAEKGLKEGARAGAREAIYGSSTPTQYLVLYAYYNNTNSSASMVGYQLLKKNRSDFPNQIANNYPKLNKYPDFRLYAADRNDIGKDIVINLSENGDFYYVIVYTADEFLKKAKNS